MEGFVPKGQGPVKYGTPAYFLTFAALILFLLSLYGYFHHRHHNEVTDDTLPTPAATKAPAPLYPFAKAPLRTPVTPVKVQAQAPVPPVVNADGNPAPAPEVDVEFDLVNRDILDRLTRDGDGRVSVAQYGVTIVPDFRPKFEGAHSDSTGFHPLDSESRPLIINEPSTIFRGGKEPKTNEAIGMTVEITYLRPLEPTGAEFHLVIKRALPDFSNPTDVKVSVQSNDETLKIPEGSAAVIAGLLPHKSNFADGEEDLYRANVLRALLEPSFQRSEDDVILVVAPLPHPVNQ